MIRFPPKRILVATDLSELSWNAYAHAVALARRFGAALEVLHVDPIPSMGPSYWPSFGDAVYRRKTLKEMRARAGRAPRLRLAVGNPSAGIVKEAEEIGADLVVMGSHGRSGFKRLLLGSVAEEVLRRSRVPVLIARGKPGALKELLAPVNFTDYSDVGFVYASAAAVGLKARLSTLYVAKEGEGRAEAQALLESMRGRVPPRVRRLLTPKLIVRRGAAPEKIAQAARGFDLIVLSAHRRPFSRDFVLGSTAERVLRRSTVPVLSVPAAGSGRWEEVQLYAGGLPAGKMRIPV